MLWWYLLRREVLSWICQITMHFSLGMSGPRSRQILLPPAGISVWPGKGGSVTVLRRGPESTAHHTISTECNPWRCLNRPKDGAFFPGGIEFFCRSLLRKKNSWKQLKTKTVLRPISSVGIKSVPPRKRLSLLKNKQNGGCNGQLITESFVSFVYIGVWCQLTRQF